MMQYPLTLRNLLERPQALFPDKEIYSKTRTGDFRYTYRDFYARACRLANVLSRLGVERGDRVGTLAWNHHRHLELYMAVPCYGAVLNTLNLRLFADQLAFIINHAGDRVIFVDDDVLPILEPLKDRLPNVRHFVIMTDEAHLPETSLSPARSYEQLMREAEEAYDFPQDIDEWSPAAMCYTSATTGNPKGVSYSHRAIYLHSLTLGLTDTLGICERDVVMPAVPMFHANAWGLPFSAVWFGAKTVLPRERLDGASLCRLIEQERITVTGGVPTLLRGIYQHLESGATHDLGSLRKLLGGGSAVPRSLIQGFQERYGISFTNSYGMTETCPVVVTSDPKSHMQSWSKDEILDVLMRQGKLMPGLEVKIVNEAGEEIKHDGKDVGEIMLRGPWVAAEYYNNPAATGVAVVDGWLRTGDIASIDSEGYIRIVDRTKDLIKSGGEWISSVDLENAIMGHPDVLEAAVVAVSHDKWQERPLAVVVPRPGLTNELTEAGVLAFLRDKVAKYWLPDRVVFADEIPKTSVGKFDKKTLRNRFHKPPIGAESHTQPNREKIGTEPDFLL
jgi:fatty-acyl-CoA synthase